MKNYTRIAWTLAVLADLVRAAGSRADERRATPNLTNERVGVARQLASLAGCELRVGKYLIAPKYWRDDLRPDVVYLQSPPPSTPVASGALLAGWTFQKASDAARVVVVPDVRKSTPEEARQRLKQVNLPTLAPSDPSSGMVVDQYPRPGQRVFEGTTVFLLSIE